MAPTGPATMGRGSFASSASVARSIPSQSANSRSVSPV
jgi:hypothetical protein